MRVLLLICRPILHPMQVICDASCTDISRSTAADWLLKVRGCWLCCTGAVVRRRLHCGTRRTGRLVPLRCCQDVTICSLAPLAYTVALTLVCPAACSLPTGPRGRRAGRGWMSAPSTSTIPVRGPATSCMYGTMPLHRATRCALFCSSQLPRLPACPPGCLQLRCVPPSNLPARR